MEYFEFINDNSNKFWQIEKVGDTKILTKWGRISKNPRETEFSYDSKELRDKDYSKKISEKIKKDYIKKNLNNITNGNQNNKESPKKPQEPTRRSRRLAKKRREVMVPEEFKKPYQLQRDIRMAAYVKNRGLNKNTNYKHLFVKTKKTKKPVAVNKKVKKAKTPTQPTRRSRRLANK